MLKNRQANRLKEYDYSKEGYYFITICTKNRKEFFGKIKNEKMILNEYGKVVKICWFDLPNHYKNCILDEFIIMPNHIHGIIEINNSVIKTDLNVETVETGFNIEKVKTDLNVETVETGFNIEKVKTDLNVETVETGFNIEKVKTDLNVETVETGFNIEKVKTDLNVGTVETGFKPVSTVHKNHGLSEIVRGFKTFSSKNINLLLKNTKFQWQRSFYDHIIKDQKALFNIRQYIINNPLKWDLDQENIKIYKHVAN